MRFEEYRKHDAVSLAELIAKREVSAKEVLEAAIARAEQINPAINACCCGQPAAASVPRVFVGPGARHYIHAYIVSTPASPRR